LKEFKERRVDDALHQSPRSTRLMLAQGRPFDALNACSGQALNESHLASPICVNSRLSAVVLFLVLVCVRSPFLCFLCLFAAIPDFFLTLRPCVRFLGLWLRLVPSVCSTND
jgi:hypothetical protein